MYSETQKLSTQQRDCTSSVTIRNPSISESDVSSVTRTNKEATWRITICRSSTTKHRRFMCL